MLLESHPLASVTMTASIVSPPQVDPSRFFELARLQVAAFFYTVTYSDITLEGGSLPGEFFALDVARCSDWGNAVQKWFMTTVAEWQPGVLAVMAEGFYRISMRKHPTLVAWSWAIEWNKGIRGVGFFGFRDSVKQVTDSLPELNWTVTAKPDGIPVRLRFETEITAEEDTLFATPEQIDSACQ